MSLPIRFAIWAAVSSDAQAADDKFSLPEQVERSRAVGLSRGWVEAVEPYVVPGESRTRWVNLSDAERAIPALHQLLDDAQSGLFDVIVCYEFDRFRELLDPVARTLSHYGVQLVSVSQPLEIQSPAEYSPYSNDSEFILRGMNQIISRASVANLRRKYMTQMPRRITERGLPHLIPYGYKKPPGHETDHNAVAVQDERAQFVLLMRDRLLAGQSINQIAADLDDLQAPHPGDRWNRPAKRWEPTTVRKILANPYYAGYVAWHKSRTTLDPRTGIRHRTMLEPRHHLLARGRHEPLWDDTTQAAIDAELARRKPTWRGRKQSALTGLLRCDICGALLWRTLYGHKPRHVAWQCSAARVRHVMASENAILDNIAVHIRTVLESESHTGPDPARHDKALADLRARRDRINDAYEAGAYDLAEFSRRASIVDDEIEALEKTRRGQAAIAAETALRAQVIELLRKYGETLSDYLHNAAGPELSQVLRALYESITVNNEGEIVNAELVKSS